LLISPGRVRAHSFKIIKLGGKHLPLRIWLAPSEAVTREIGESFGGSFNPTAWIALARYADADAITRIRPPAVLAPSSRRHVFRRTACG
jgi:hypothetical protein